MNSQCQCRCFVMVAFQISVQLQKVYNACAALTLFPVFTRSLIIVYQEYKKLLHDTLSSRTTG